MFFTLLFSPSLITKCAKNDDCKRLITGRGSYSLTELSKQYFFPTVENGKESAAIAILATPKAFAVLVQKFDGGKLPTAEMIGNIVHKESGIPVSKKDTVASIFIRSAQFLGVVDSNGFLRCKAFVASGNRIVNSPPPTPDEELKRATERGEVPKEFSINVKNSLYLNKERDREVTLNCPFSITRAEYDRICNWIKATWIIEEENKNEQI
jgi:hypothetical protein